MAVVYFSTDFEQDRLEGDFRVEKSNNAATIVALESGTVFRGRRSLKVSIPNGDDDLARCWVTVPRLTGYPSDIYVRWMMRHTGLSDDVIIGIIEFCEGSITHGDVRLVQTGAIRVRSIGPGVSYTSQDTGLRLTAANTWYRCEVRYKVDDSVGLITIRVNGVEESLDSNIDTRNGGTGVLDTLRFGIASKQGTGGAGFTAFLDSLAIGDGWLGAPGRSPATVRTSV